MGTVFWECAIKEAGYELGLSKWVGFEEEKNRFGAWMAGRQGGVRTRHAAGTVRSGPAEQSSCGAIA